jgi:hypothetical protein
MFFLLSGKLLKHVYRFLQSAIPTLLLNIDHDDEEKMPCAAGQKWSRRLRFVVGER